MKSSTMLPVTGGIIQRAPYEIIGDMGKMQHGAGVPVGAAAAPMPNV